MKKMMTNIKTLAALLIASATFVACSSDDNTIDQQPAQPAGQQVYTMTVNASKGGDAATTRALTLSGKTLNATWATTENIYVKKDDTWATGSLKPQTDGTTATLKGTLSGIEINASDVLTLQFPRSGALDYTGQVGTLADIAAKYDYATATVTVKSVSATGNIIPTEATTTFQNQQAIVKFTLIDKAGGTTPLAATQLTVSDGTNTYTVTPVSATSEIYVAIPGFSSQTVTLTATTGSGTYTYEKANVTFTNGKYYEIAVKMVAAEPEGLAAPLTVEALTAGTVKVNINGTLSTGMKYSVNGGAKTTITTTTSIAVNAGDKVRFYGNGTATQVYGDSPEVKILGDGADFTCKAYGNIMSLLDEENFATKTDLPNQTLVFWGLFYGNTALTDASTLLLPATTLAKSCYNSMFRDCKALTAAPALPATTLAELCYFQMFHDCKALTAAPALPATTLATRCYDQMFDGCSALTAAPALPATTLAEKCYNYMFNGCSNLSSVTCLATEGINQNNSTNWLNGVAASGTFTAATDATWPEGVDGIPSGWTKAYRPLAEATAEDVGNVVCADGHLHKAKTAVPAGCTAVGILGKVTETGHGLILALQDATSQTWNTINGWTSVTTYAGTTLKVLPDAAARGSLTSYTTLGETTVSNWAVAQKSDYQAIFTNLGSTTGDDAGRTCDANVNAYITTGVGGTAISYRCWSATEYSSNTAWGFVSALYWNGGTKGSSSSVRPVLGF